MEETLAGVKQNERHKLENKLSSIEAEPTALAWLTTLTINPLWAMVMT